MSNCDETPDPLYEWVRHYLDGFMVRLPKAPWRRIRVLR